MKLDSKNLRSVASTFPTGVSIITVKDSSGDVHGMTASSFQSVSLDPPLVSFCVKEKAKTFSLLEKETPLGISILSKDQSDVSSQFAGFNQEDIEVPLVDIGDGIKIVDAALGWYGTQVRDIIPAGDHFLILCQVKEIGKREEGLPLVYWSGYKSVQEL